MQLCVLLKREILLARTSLRGSVYYIVQGNSHFKGIVWGFLKWGCISDISIVRRWEEHLKFGEAVRAKVQEAYQPTAVDNGNIYFSHLKAAQQKHQSKCKLYLKHFQLYLALPCCQKAHTNWSHYIASSNATRLHWVWGYFVCVVVWLLWTRTNLLKHNNTNTLSDPGSGRPATSMFREVQLLFLTKESSGFEDRING